MRAASFTEKSKYRDTPEGLHASDDGRFLVGGVVPVSDDAVAQMVRDNELNWVSEAIELWALDRLGLATVNSEPVPASALPQPMASNGTAQPPAAEPSASEAETVRARTRRTSLKRPLLGIIAAVALMAVVGGIAIGALVMREDRGSTSDLGFESKLGVSPRNASSTEDDAEGLPESEQPPAEEAVPTEPAPGQESPSISQAASEYASELGGVSHDGDALYLIIGASTNSEELTQQRLDAAVPAFGDMQSYFIVQRSENFEGLEPGWFVVVEAYRDGGHAADNLEFAARGFEEPYVKRVVVRTTDPIPVYEDIVGN